MKLFRTACSTDWKGRPDHKLKQLATSDDLAWLKKTMDEDVQQWQAEDIANDERLEAEERGEDIADDDAKARVEELKKLDLSTLWPKQHERWEMVHASPDEPKHREFAWKLDGDLSSVVYHFVD